MIASILPSISAKTWRTVVGLGLPERFALGAAIGDDFAISSCAIGCDGKRIATVESPALTSSGIISDFGITIVSGPGQNFSASFFALSENSATSISICLISEIWTISGLSIGLPFALNILATASPFKASAASP